MEPFKNLLNEPLVQNLAAVLQRCDGNFNASAFVSDVLSQLETLELKARSQWIRECLAVYLPEDFPKAAAILLAALGEPADHSRKTVQVDEPGLSGWVIMPLSDYIAQHGQAYFELSMQLLKEMTKRSTSEFAIRYFLRDQPEATLKQMQAWAFDSDEHVRRLASEGSRPRLPWGMQLARFVENPEPLLPILEALKDDPSEYVRRSVANNINDIAKDHPEWVVGLAERWMQDASETRKRLLRHACRTLIKQGHAPTLAVFGYQAIEGLTASATVSQPLVVLGGSVEIFCSISAALTESQPIIIDYRVHHQKANGSTTGKVFKWKTATLKNGAKLNERKKHSLKRVTTRVYYPGFHRVEVLVNGEVVAETGFELVIPN